MARKKRKTREPFMKQNDPIDVRKAIEAEETLLLRINIQKYREQQDTLRARVQSDPTLPLREKIANSGQISIEVSKLEEMWAEIMPYVRKIKSSIPDVLDQTRLVACYLLLGKVSQGIEAIFMLLREGFHYVVMEIVRSNREALDLIALFLQEPENSPLVTKWFDGEIVKNVKAREAADKHLTEVAQQTGLPLSIEGMKSGIYGVLSKYSHVSYGAILESYDVYHEDFDFDRITGHHYALNSSRSYVHTEIHGVIIALKGVYQAMGDAESYREVDAILRKYAPHMYDREGMKNDNAALVERYSKK